MERELEFADSRQEQESKAGDEGLRSEEEEVPVEKIVF